MPRSPLVKTIRAQWLGHHLRRLRTERGLTLGVVSLRLHRDMTTLSRYERGETPIRTGDLAALLDLYGLPRAAERARLLTLADQLRRTDHWDDDANDDGDHNAAGAGYADRAWLASRAVQIKSYGSTLVPDPLQTPEYAAAIGNPRTGGLPDALARGRRPRIVAVIHENALRHRAWRPEVMRGQLERLLALGRRRDVDIRVLRADDAGPDAVPDHSFHLYAMPAPYPPVAYLEYLGGRLYLEVPRSTRFADAYAHLRARALNRTESAALIVTIAKLLRESENAAGSTRSVSDPPVPP